MGYLIQEGKTIQYLRDYLIAHGYPSESIYLEYPIGNCRVDLAVVDPITSLPMQLFEIKSNPSDYSLERGRKQLRKISQELPNNNFTTFLVYPIEQRPFFKVKQVFCRVPEKTEVDINLTGKTGAELNFQIQKASSRSGYIETIKEDKNRNIKKLKFIFSILSIILAAILFSEIMMDIILNNSTTIITLPRLYVVILIVFMQAFPFISSIKFANCELDLLTDRERK